MELDYTCCALSRSSLIRVLPGSSIHRAVAAGRAQSTFELFTRSWSCYSSLPLKDGPSARGSAQQSQRIYNIFNCMYISTPVQIVKIMLIMNKLDINHEVRKRMSNYWIFYYLVSSRSQCDLLLEQFSAAPFFTIDWKLFFKNA